MSPAIEKKNAAFLAKKQAQREIRALRKAHKKVPAELLVQVRPPQPVATEPKPPTKQAQADARITERADAKVVGVVTKAELRHRVRQQWPDLKGLADATEGELVQALKSHPGDSILAELQETWRKRSSARHAAWMTGDSTHKLLKQIRDRR